MAGRHGYTDPTNSQSPTGPAQMGAINAFWDQRVGESAANLAAFPVYTDRPLGHQIMAQDTEAMYVRAASGWQKFYDPAVVSASVVVLPSSVGGTSVAASSAGLVTFSTASSINLNGVFSSEFARYQVQWRILTSANAALSGRLRLSGSDVATSAYQVGASGLVSSWALSAAPGGASWLYGELILDGPAVPSPTTAQVASSVRNNASGNITDVRAGGYESTSTAFDGLSLILSTGTGSGSVSVTGLRP